MIENALQSGFQSAEKARSVRAFFNIYIRRAGNRMMQKTGHETPTEPAL
jgi:hypothetical protein